MTPKSTPHIGETLRYGRGAALPANKAARATAAKRSPGLTITSRSDRMDIMPPPDPSDATLHAHRDPRPAICPACGLTADNGIVVRSELTTTATYCCTEAHLFAVTWVEVTG